MNFVAGHLPGRAARGEFRRVRPTFAAAALFVAWLCANGAAWDVMQVVAWGRMFAGYSATMTVAQALQKTLDPTKPCEMCVAIRKAKGAHETAKPAQAPEQGAPAKLVLALDAADEPVFANDPGDWPAGTARRITERAERVPVPPPRA